MTTDQKQDACGEVKGRKEANDYRKQAFKKARLEMPKFSTPKLAARWGFLMGFRAGRVYEAQQRTDLGAVREALETLDAIELHTTHENVDLFLKGRQQVRALLTTPQASPVYAKPHNEQLYAEPYADPATPDETAFQAFMLAVHEHGTSGLGYRKALAAYEAARTLPRIVPLTEAQIASVIGYGNPNASAHPDRAEVAEPYVFDKSPKPYDDERALWSAIDAFHGCDKDAGFHMAPCPALYRMEKTVRAYLSSIPTRDDGKTSREYIESMLEKHADHASMFQPETEVIETRWVRLMSVPTRDDGGVVEDLAGALEAAVDSLRYVQDAHPEATGRGVRAERIQKAERLIARYKDQQAAGAV